MTLVIYDSLGTLISSMSGSYTKPTGDIKYLEVEVPDGKYVKGVDITVTPNVAIFIDAPKPEIETVKEELALVQEALNELILGGM